jgi:fatty acid desaturase
MSGDPMVRELWLWMVLSFVAFVVLVLFEPLWLALLLACCLATVGFARGWHHYYGHRRSEDYRDMQRALPGRRASSRVRFPS